VAISLSFTGSPIHPPSRCSQLGRERRRRCYGRERAAAVRVGEERERGREIFLGGREGAAGAAHGGGRRGARLGRARGGGGGWAKNGEGGGVREKKKVFLFLKNLLSLDECIYILKQSKSMHGSAWCITQNKVF
jgi:hypothetical protein